MSSKPHVPLPDSCSVLTPLFRSALFSVDDWCCNGHDTGRHEEWCSEDRIVITRGGLWALRSRGREQLADPLQAVLWNGNSEFRVRHPIGGGDQCTVLRLSPAGSAALRSSQNRTPVANTFARASSSLSARSFALHWQLLLATRGKDYQDALAIEQTGLELCRELTSAEVNEAEACVPKAVYRAREVIAQRALSNLTLEQLATAVGSSPFHLARQFKRVFGLSPHQAIIAWRLRVGLERVLDQKDEFAGLALDLGFASHSHFSDSFRAHYGCSPQHARKHWKRLSPLSDLSL